MIYLLEIFLLFFIPANILLLLFGLKHKEQLQEKIILFVSYGAAPLLSSLLLYYLIWFFPEKPDLFYLLFIFSFWAILLLVFAKNWRKVVYIYKKFYFLARENIFQKRNLLFLPILIFLFLFSIQALFYPIVDNDKALYLNQSEAVYEYKKLDWKKESNILIRGNDEYYYNSMIRPAIPYFMAFSFMISKDEGYFIFKFLSSYYYFLLLGLFLVIVYELAGKLKQNKFKAMFFGFLFFTFSWTLTRSFIFNSKETIIYFLALLSLYLFYCLIKIKKRNYLIEILLGITVGSNMFVNLHGIIIGFFVILLLLIFSSLKWSDRFKQVIFIFIVNLFFGAFELFKMFGFVFASNLKFIQEVIIAIWNSLRDFFLSLTENFFQKYSGDTQSGNQGDNTSISKFPVDKEDGGVSSLDQGHLGLYQMSGLLDVYLRGKLQILTNVGVFGFYFWFFLVALFVKLKEIIKSRLGKIILAFIVIYFLVVLDPFNINHHKYAVILWGSTKYASLVMLLSLIFISVYADLFFKTLFNFLKKKLGLATIFIGTILFLSVILKDKIISLGVKLLLSVIPKFKDISFYQGKIENFYYAAIVFLLLALVILFLLKIKKTIVAYYIFIASLVFVFVVFPFFLINTGKVYLKDTFDYLNKERRVKLENTVYYGDIYRIYFYAKEKLPKNTKIKIMSEGYTYDDYFEIKRNVEEVNYAIEKECGDDSYSLQKEGEFNLCKIGE